MNSIGGGWGGEEGGINIVFPLRRSQVYSRVSFMQLLSYYGILNSRLCMGSCIFGLWVYHII